MSIATIEQFVEQENRLAKLFGEKPLSLLNAKDRQRIADKIDASLSPENLTCDGELTRSQVNQKYRFLTKCAQELLSIDSTVKFYEYE